MIWTTGSTPASRTSSGGRDRRHGHDAVIAIRDVDGVDAAPKCGGPPLHDLAGGTLGGLSSAVTTNSPCRRSAARLLNKKRPLHFQEKSPFPGSTLLSSFPVLQGRGGTVAGLRWFRGASGRSLSLFWMKGSRMNFRGIVARTLSPFP